MDRYGEITVRIKYREAVRPKKLVLTVHPTDSMKNIAEQINQKLQCTVMEIKSLVLKEKHKLEGEDWNNGTSLKFDDTVVSAQLYQDNCIVLAQCKDTVERMLIF